MSNIGIEGVCDYLNDVPDVKAVMADVLSELDSQGPMYPNDIIHAAATVTAAAGELMKQAVNIYYCFDDPDSRTELLRTAAKSTAECLRFLMEIGNLKGAQ